MIGKVPSASYTFTVKESGHDPVILITKALLFLAGLVTFTYRNANHYYLTVAIGILQLLSGIFLNTIIVKYKVSRLLLLIVAVMLLLAATAYTFAVIVVIYACLIKLAFKKPFVLISSNGVAVTNILFQKSHPWAVFNNIMLKDGLLSFDFKTNKLLQLDVVEIFTVTNQDIFNNFCRQHILVTDDITIQTAVNNN